MPNTIKGVEIDPIREKLIELLKECFDIGFYCPDDVADHLIANGVTISNLETVDKEWISVSEPPKKDGRYLVAKKIFNKIIWQEVLSFAKDGRKVDKYDFHRGWKNVWYRYDGEWGHLTIDDVTHWMPLPQPPKGE